MKPRGLRTLWAVAMSPMGEAERRTSIQTRGYRAYPANSARLSSVRVVQFLPRYGRASAGSGKPLMRAARRLYVLRRRRLCGLLNVTPELTAIAKASVRTRAL